MNKKIAIIGNREQVQGFSLLGVEVVPTADAATAREKLLALRRDSDYAAVFVMEDVMAELSAEDERKIATSFTPAVIPVSSLDTSTGYGTARLRRLVERAVGSDITITEK